MIAWEWDPVRDRLSTSGPATEVFGLPPGETLTTAAQAARLVHPDDRERYRMTGQEATRSGQNYRVEIRIVRPIDGETVWVEERGIVLRNRATGRERIVGVTWDITERKRAEDARRHSEERYRALFDSIDEGFCVIEVLCDESGGALDYRFLEVNPAFEKQTGIEQAVGKRMREVAPAHEEHWFEIYGQVALTGRPIRFEARAEALHRWYDVYAFRVGAPGARRVAILFKDITERKRRELNAGFLAGIDADFVRLSRSEDILRVAAEKIGRYLGVPRVAFAEADEAAGAVTVLEDYHEAGMRSGLGVHGLSDYVSDVHLSELRAGRTVAVADVATDPHTAPRADAYRAFQIGSVIYAPYLSDGRFKFVLSAQRREPHRWRADETELMRELSARIWLRLERARAEEALRESEARFRTMANGSPNMIWVIDAVGRVEFLNRTYLEFFGIALAEAATFDWSQAVHPDDRGVYLAAFRAAVGTQQPLHARARVRRADGQWRWIESRGHPRVDAAGRVTGYIGSSPDITEIWDSQQALKDADRRKDEFLATLAHELRNPLAPIRQAAGIARAANATEAQIRWSHDVIERQVEHMSLLLDDLLDVSRITRGKLTLRKERVDVRSVIDTAIEGARPFIETRQHRLHIDPPPQNLRLEADPLRLAQVFTNLLTNAAKYTDPGGTIRVSIRCEGEAVVVAVADNGIGIPPQALPRMFEMFLQVQSALDRTGSGLGIGLALSKGLVELHGGSIVVHSEGVGRGSTFTVRLPGVCADAARAAAPRAPPPARDAGRRRKVLVVDDNRDAAETLAALLEIDGHEVRTAHDGLAALAAGASSKPDCMILDIGMPKLNGYEVARRLRQEDWGRNVLLIATTGWGKREDRERALALGFDHHLTKPVDPAELQALIDAPGDSAIDEIGVLGGRVSQGGAGPSGGGGEGAGFDRR